MRHPEADTLALELRSHMADVFEPRDIRRGPDGRSWRFYGRLTAPAADALVALRPPFARLGYAPFLADDGVDDLVIAVPAAEVIPAPRRWGLQLGLLLLTAATLVVTGALLQAARSAPLAFSLGGVLDALAEHSGAGLIFAAAVLLILGAHEMGHYMAARRHGLLISLPYFLPAPPPPLGLGTFGAFIAMRSPAPGRAALFDVALAGPLAGLAAALPILVVGLLTAPLAALPVAVQPPLVAGGLARLLRGPLPDGMQIDWFAPLLFAAWLGLLATAINLLPIGQLDGGHLAYAALGPGAVWLARVTWVGLLLLIPFAPTWAVYAVLTLVIGLRHPPPQDDITPLDGRRRLWALAALILLLLTFSPRPLP